MVLAPMRIVVPRARTIVVMDRAGPAVLIAKSIEAVLSIPTRRCSK
mgnify:FL=1|jgi:hypothetical protein